MAHFLNMHWAVLSRRVVLLVVNVVATSLALLRGVHDNALVALITGRFGHIRQRLRDGRISYNIAAAALAQIPSYTLPNLPSVADNYEFHAAPMRSPASIGEDRNTCRRVNSMSATTLGVYFDDLFGQGPRREQLFIWSISAPSCDVINFQPHWIQQQCNQTTECEAYVLAHFDELQHQRAVHVGIPVDFGEVGVPYLRCKGRSAAVRFQYLTDLMVFQSFWAGGSFQVEFQTSMCWAEPVAYNAQQDYRLFRVQAADQQSTVVVAVPSIHWSISLVSMIYSVVYLAFLVRGVVATMATGHQSVLYFPAATKHTVFGWLGDWIPSVTILSWFTSVKDHTKVFQFQAESIVAANMWLNEWIYISVSIADANLKLRSGYMMFTMGAWMLKKRVTLSNFLFVCTPLTKMTWITCLAHTLFQRGMRFVLNAMRVGVTRDWAIRSIDSIRWYIDSVALFTTFKFYCVALVFQLYIVLHVKGTPTISTRVANAKQPVYGGFTDLTNFWHCEIAVDMFFIVAVQIVVAHVVGTVLLRTKLRLLTHNRVLRILQRRYFFVGWDVFVAMDALGIEPFSAPCVDVNGTKVVPTNCSAGVLLRQLASSGPSGWVRFAGEDGFARTRGHAKEETMTSAEINCTLSVARDMGICQQKTRRRRSVNALSMRDNSISPIGRRDGSAMRSRLFLQVSHSLRSIMPQPTHTTHGPEFSTNVIEEIALPPFQERILHAHTESIWGSFMLVDFERHPPRYLGQRSQSNRVSSRLDTIIQHQHWQELMNDKDESHIVIVRDALWALPCDDRQRLLSGDLHLQIC